ncbi:MAG: hypothetical protein IJ689_02900 [Alphaproteobacteria bacterium]|nr:hypothetical protein [Alphaproteobacteria bacterium]
MIKLVKKFWLADAEAQAAILMCIGTILLALEGILTLAVDVPDTIEVQIATGVLLAIFGTGCLELVWATRKEDDIVPRLMITGSAGMFGLMCFEVIVRWLVERIFDVLAPQVTAWYALPCVFLFFLGLLILAGREVRERWRNA